jgi:hypothetical protein
LLVVASLISALALGGVATAPAGAALRLTVQETVHDDDLPGGWLDRGIVYANGKKAGTSRWVCEFVYAPGADLVLDEPEGVGCRSTFELAGGKLRFRFGYSLTTRRGPVTITGGTGRYAGATGNGRVRYLGFTRTRFTLRVG